MSIHLPERRYLTLGELQQRWKCDVNDLREIICTGALSPSWYANGYFSWAEWVADNRRFADEQGLVPEVRTNSNGAEITSDLKGWYFLRCPYETGPLNCSFDMLCDSATDPPEKDDGGFPPYAFWYYLENKIDLKAVESNGVFMLTEVARFESQASTTQVGDGGAERPLKTRERNTLLTIVSALCSIAKLPVENSSKTAQVISSEAQRCGLDLPERTVAEKLKQLPAARAARGR